MKRRLPPFFYNATTLFGMTFAVVMLILALVMIALDLLTGFSNSYSGLITYIALPSLMFFGLFIALIGLLVARRKHRRGHATDQLPVVDFNKPRHRFLVTSFAVGGLVLMAISGFGASKGYEYTESVQFCGTTCHMVMEPEYTTFQGSPHAHVTCAGCHVGEGADYYVKSKLSGSYQLYSVLFNKFERPIKTPVSNLRPAKETCEKCHWPKHFFAQKLRTHEYFLSDETNSPYNIAMLVKIGGGEGMSAQGIHAHMYLDSQISYVSTDPERQVIPYVEVTDQHGKVTVFRDDSLKATDADLAKGEHRIVDCIDCHNRPTHIFRPAETLMNKALSTNSIDKTIPEIKSEGVEVLDAKYKDVDEAMSKIESELKKYYNETYAEFMAKDSAKLDQAIKVIQNLYRKNYFPLMNTDWRSHVDNLDHMHDTGCFRCHNDRLKSPTGKVISKNCNTCHTIVAQGKPGAMKSNYNGMAFEHPVDVGEDWKTTPCKDCHGKPAAEEPAK